MLKRVTTEYLDDVLVRLAPHSSAIEGNTITLAETVSIILYGTILGAPSTREFYETDNHRPAFEYLLDCLEEEQPLSIFLINNLHRLLMDRLVHDTGQCKKHENAILGSDLITAKPAQTLMLMQQWIENLNYQLATDDISGFIRFAKELLVAESVRASRFLNKAAVQINYLKRGKLDNGNNITSDYG